LSLIQHSTKLFLINHASLGWVFISVTTQKRADRMWSSDEHFYQLGLRQFGAFDRLRLEPAPDLKELLMLAAGDESGMKENGLVPEEVVNVSCLQHMSHGDSSRCVEYI
jgi:DNA mismatch repair protein MLH1